MHTSAEVRRGRYLDSIVLMQLQVGLCALEGVIDAGAAMATPHNLAVLADADLLALSAEEIGALGADDLIIAVRAEDEEAAEQALAEVDQLLDGQRQRSSDSRAAYLPKTLAAALDMRPDFRWVSISTPGRFAARVAREALEANRNVFLYSDNVSVEAEVELKQAARERGLLMLGPDCGTSILGGIGLGFANRCELGAIGLVGASGTGLQAVSCRLETLGVGISHALGTGGRDLSTAVGGLAMVSCIGALGRDESTEVIALISKPPAPSVLPGVVDALRSTGKPAVLYFQGLSRTVSEDGNLHYASSLEEAAVLAAALLADPAKIALPPRMESAEDAPPEGAEPSGGSGRQRAFLRAFFSGGTLALEAHQYLRLDLPSLTTNLDEPLELTGITSPGDSHLIVDVGSDELTEGRLHPMIDPDLRVRMIERALEDSATGLVLFDLVLGDGAAMRPAQALASVCNRARDLEIPMVCLLIATVGDPQDAEVQIAQLRSWGVGVHVSTETCFTEIAATLRRQPIGSLRRSSPRRSACGGAGNHQRGPRDLRRVAREPGSRGVARRVAPSGWGRRATDQDPGCDEGFSFTVTVTIRVDLTVTATVTAKATVGAGFFGEHTMSVDIERANQRAVENMIETHPQLERVALAREVIPILGDGSRSLLHAGPPIEWSRMAGPLRGAIVRCSAFRGMGRRRGRGARARGVGRHHLRLLPPPRSGGTDGGGHFAVDGALRRRGQEHRTATRGLLEPERGLRQSPSLRRLQLRGARASSVDERDAG